MRDKKKLRLESEQLELENAQLRGEIMSKSELMRVLVDLQRALSNIPIRIKDTARVQSPAVRNDLHAA
jgi:hypothetical protein